VWRLGLRVAGGRGVCARDGAAYPAPVCVCHLRYACPGVCVCAAYETLPTHTPTRHAHPNGGGYEAGPILRNRDAARREIVFFSKTIIPPML